MYYGMSTSFRWHLTFTFAEFTPREAEAITSLSVGMQRDWRQRGFLPKFEKHARFDAFMIAEMWVLKMFADRGIGPSRASSKSQRIAAAVVLAALRNRDDAWAGSRPIDLFDQIPPETRSPTPEERFGWEMDIYEKRDWLATKAVERLGYSIERASDAIWWPTGDVQFGNYSDIAGSTADTPPDDRVDPRFDGAAIVLGIDFIAQNLVRKSGRPLLHAEVAMHKNVVPSDSWCDHGNVTVIREGNLKT